ncbi:MULTISPECIES: ribose-5-phosphate isomerase RpiA [Leuconostoc]|uniref:Ribose-5-phosphate isomerase A n=2 Tax=Leuconostoc kimchii TaxID=136609 RepID=D5T107_LEUKI|nr:MULTISPECIES: ribose-5-phosphate isomerase RpiA [Leuconostoc]ADG39956.1 ribose-5-phosphate isomerase A [Leuconostoc kimchii IMSNU 11154]AEJ30245.1 ribose-5-phosphate isomerase A [Leuconostoc sp. C2]QBR47325.1 ribose-5-phosphate isomerase RpiA [Leuconostoc kimchii]
MENISLEKKHAAVAASQLIKNGMTVGLGTGSTVNYFLDALATRIRQENLKIVGVTTSFKTANRAESLGITIIDIDDAPAIDLTVDGADEVDNRMNGIKGGGAAFLMEKIVAHNSNRVVWIIDSQKRHQQLGRFPLPVEIVPFGSGKLIADFKKRHLHPVLRQQDGKTVVTDMGHFIVDLVLNRIDQPYQLGQYLDSRIGVVEHGLFLGVADEIIIGTSSGVRQLKRDALQK